MVNTLAVRYEESIDRRDVDKYTVLTMLPENERRLALEYHPVTIRQAKLADLKDGDWLEGVFNQVRLKGYTNNAITQSRIICRITD